jgi:HPt (histidine-containing phosphotransfer) domain-containing protein
MMSKLVDYALEYIGKKELEWYCMEIETKEIDLKALKQHLIGKVGLDETEVMNLYREDKNDQR